MNFVDWYTDQMDIARVRSVQNGALTVQEREQVGENIPCRVYRHKSHAPRMQSTAAYGGGGDALEGDMLACDNGVDIQAGDELTIRRGGALGQARLPIRAFAGEPSYFYEPFGAVVPGLAHQEVALYQKEYLKGEIVDGDG